MADKKFSKDEVLKLWSEKAGGKDLFDLRVVESVDGTQQTQLINKAGGALVVAANGDNAVQTLGERVGDPFIDAGVNPKEASEDDKAFFTSEGVIATPTQPEAVLGVAKERTFKGGSEVKADKA